MHCMAHVIEVFHFHFAMDVLCTSNGMYFDPTSGKLALLTIYFDDLPQNW